MPLIDQDIIQGVTFNIDAQMFTSLINFTAKPGEDIRDNLSGICIERNPKREKGVIMVATNGHTLLARYDTDGELDTKDKSYLVLSPYHTGFDDKVPDSNFKKILNNRGRLVCKNGRIFSDRLEERSVHLENHIMITPFPNWKAIMASYYDAESIIGQIQLNANYIGRFALKNSHNIQLMQVKPKEKGEPNKQPLFIVQHEGLDDDMIGMIMPARLGKLTERNKWMNDIKDQVLEAQKERNK